LSPCRKKNLLLEALKSTWPGEKKGNPREKDGKSTRNLLKTRNDIKIEAHIWPRMHDLNKAATVALPISRAFPGILKELSRVGK